MVIVSLFTREWIEIIRHPLAADCVLSPSLRGSGLKLDGNTAGLQSYRLPLYEGVD